jgi:hypothetical protein
MTPCVFIEFCLYNIPLVCNEPIETTLGTYMKGLGGIAGFDSCTSVCTIIYFVCMVSLTLSMTKMFPTKLHWILRSTGVMDLRSTMPEAAYPHWFQPLAVALGAHPAVTHLEIDEVVLQETISCTPVPWGWSSISTCNITKWVFCVISWLHHQVCKFLSCSTCHCLLPINHFIISSFLFFSIKCLSLSFMSTILVLLYWLFLNRQINSQNPNQPQKNQPGPGKKGRK